jgi:low affinity Fe/Cu permease
VPRSLSDLIRRIGGVAAGERVAAVIAVAVAVWLLLYWGTGFPEWMAKALQTVAAGTTLVMVFVLQHAQRRTETAIQLKLDALIHASDANDELVAIEHADHDELDDHRRSVEDAVDHVRARP